MARQDRKLALERACYLGERTGEKAQPSRGRPEERETPERLQRRLLGELSLSERS